jgi:outer membrane protein
MRSTGRWWLPALLAASSLAAQANDLSAIQQILGDSETSPVPAGWTLGGVGYSGSSAYQDGKDTTAAIPGAIYIGPQFMYLGDRAYYTFGKQGPVAFFGRLRVRLGNLDPDDSPAFAGMHERKGQLEAGLGAVAVTSVGIWTARFSSDISGRSDGTEVLLGWSAPIVHERWLVMPSVGVFWRSDKLANYYFGGVSGAEAAPGRPAYDVGNAWSLSPSLVASYRFDRHWLAGLVLSYDAFSDAIRDSPLVQQKGRYDALIALGYVWR